MMKPSRGEVWEINFDPSIGSEIKKRRPAAVISADTIGKLPLRIVVPITEWKPKYAEYPWQIRIDNNVSNGLSKVSAADAFQVKSVDEKRFMRKMGSLTKSQVSEIAAAIAICIDFEISV